MKKVSTAARGTEQKYVLPEPDHRTGSMKW